MRTAWMTWLLGLAGTTSAALGSDLRWKNGQSVGGTLMEATDKVMTFRAEPIAERFLEPLVVEMHVLSGLEIKQGKNTDWSSDEMTKEPFGIRLDDGTRLFGTITGLDEKNLTISAPTFGKIDVSRSAVTSIQRMNGKGILFAGPASRRNWKDVSGSNTKTTGNTWRVMPGGYVSQVAWNHAVHMPLELPERVELQLTLRSTERPEFKIELATELAEAKRERCIVETWDDEIVLQGREFASLAKLTPETRAVTLRLFWDRKSSRCAIFDGSGKKLAETDMPAVVAPVKKAEVQPTARPQVGGIAGALLGLIQARNQARQPVRAEKVDIILPGLTLLNKGANLTLHDLQVREWQGGLPDVITNELPRVELTDGRVLKGRLVRATAADFTVSDSGKETTLPWPMLSAALQASDNLGASWFVEPEASVALLDGMWLPGKLLSKRGPKLELRTSYSEKPVFVMMRDVARIDIKVPVPADAQEPKPLGQLDKLVSAGKTLNGTLVTDGGAVPRWRAVGALNDVALVMSQDLEITRAPNTVSEKQPATLFYLKSGDILPGSLKAMDEKKVDVSSTLAAAQEFQASEVQAIQFAGTALNTHAFDDRGWRITRGSATQVKHENEWISMEPGGAYGHPAFMQVDELSFKLASNGFSAVRLRLFCSGVDPTSKSLNLLFGHMGNEAIFGVEKSPDSMDTQNRIAAPPNVPVRVVIQEKFVEVFMNGVSLRKVSLTPAMKSGIGIIIEPFSLWGNGERSVKLTNFVARAALGRVAMPVVDGKAKANALLVPRFRKEDPPKHVLVAGNGDLLRGVIEAATSKHFAVRTGLETVQVPLERVSAAIWLEKPDNVTSKKDVVAKAEPPPNPFVVKHCLMLNNGGRLALEVTKFDKDAIIGQHPRLGECRVPLADIHMIRSSAPEENALLRSFQEWKLAYTPEPVLPESGGQSSPLLTKDAPSFTLPLLAGGDFNLADEKGKVIVLDFWATWCGPCIKSMPDMISKLSEFDAKKVRFIAVNQAEAKEQVKTFLETRSWKMEVAMDAQQRVGQQFGVEGIPHTVVIGRDGRVVLVKTGYEPDGAEKIAESVKKALAE